MEEKNSDQKTAQEVSNNNISRTSVYRAYVQQKEEEQKTVRGGRFGIKEPRER